MLAYFSPFYIIIVLQHIEDLTQEKFSLQRALEASRVLAESLAAENSSLTDNYNQQVSLWSVVCHSVGYTSLKLLQLCSIRCLW